MDYEIKCQNDRYLSFLITETETQATAFQQLYPYSIDLESGKELTLRDLLGPDWKEIVNASVREQIAQRSQDPDHVYWGGDDYSEAFTSIRDNQPFYQSWRKAPAFRHGDISHTLLPRKEILRGLH